ncbi:MAG: glycerate kinase, partial [Mycobacterium sp.]
MRVLVAPDCYGDSLSAVEAAAAIATGWSRSRPGDMFIVAPQSDGGPGFVKVLGSRLGETRRLRVCGPLDATVEAQWVFDPGSATAYLECAQACGLTLLDGVPTPETAMSADSSGVGQLIAEALRAGAAQIVVGLGGSACTDGGKGMITQLGGLDAARRQLADVELIAASDTEYPLLGPWGAASVFGPQKGADHATVLALEARLTKWAAELDAAAGREVSAEPG